MKNAAIQSLGIIALLYIVGVFISLEWDVTQWHRESRFLFVLFSAFGIFTAVLYRAKP